MIKKFMTCASMLLAVDSKGVKLEETRESKDTIKSLILPEGEKGVSLIYTYKTILEYYSDQSSITYLQATLELQNVNTKYFTTTGGSTGSSVRMSVGWRNPQEDAYDIHSFNIDYKYDTNGDKLHEIQAIDGYCSGSIHSQYYRQDNVPTGVDQYGKFNTSIQQWTDYPAGYKESVNLDYYVLADDNI